MSELKRFVLEYVEEAGGIVEPTGPGIHELLLPQRLAEAWKIPSYLKLAFGDTEHPEAIQLGYNHPLVEQMVATAQSQPASARLFVRELGLNKTGLAEVAAKEWRILNARVVAQERATIDRVRSTYVRFNFKVEILSDEKQERLVSVLMDAHGGYRVAKPAPIEVRANAPEPGDLLPSLADAPMRWQPGNGPPLSKPLDERALEALLERAKEAALQEMAGDLDALQKRVARFCELDEARLGEYYQELERDLQHRLGSASSERRPSLEEKLAAVKREREQKLADVAERYRIRLNLTLLNLLVIQQPKLVVPVNIENRTTQIGVYAVWDPLLHQLEPLSCQVCGEPGRLTYLCYNGHLAHKDCLAPACIECKRVFCQHCSGEVGECDVCHGPLCRHSRIVCGECGRGTCQEHQGLCHADEGEPVDLTAGPEPAQPPEQEVAPSSPAKAKSQTPARGKRKGKRAGKSTSAPRPAPRKRFPKPKRIEVVADPTAVVAYVLAAKEKTIAVRAWELVPNEGGLVRTCECEKGDECKATNMILRPPEVEGMEPLLLQEIAVLRREYGLPAGKVHFNRMSSLSGEPLRWPRLELFGLWKEEEALEQARATFSRLYWK